jgi:predicted nucleic acid-binding protein
VLVGSDTSPVRCLAHLERVHLLPGLFESVSIPPAVANEPRAYHPRFPPLEVEKLPGVRVQGPADTARVAVLDDRLYRGEVEAIALALPLHATLLIELRGRPVAVRLGLEAVGTLAVRGRAKVASLLPAVRPWPDRLVREVQFFVAPELLDEFLKAIGE